jgi:hypothetical protein
MYNGPVPGTGTEEESGSLGAAVGLQVTGQIDLPVMQKEAAHVFLGRPHESLSTVLMNPRFEGEIVHHFQRSDGGNERAMQVIAGSERRLMRQQKRLQKIHRTRLPGGSGS